MRNLAIVVLLLGAIWWQQFTIDTLQQRVEDLAGVVQGLERDISQLPGGNQP